MNKAQGALTAALKNNESTNTMKRVSEALHKTSKYNYVQNVAFFFSISSLLLVVFCSNLDF